jgi:hypothetical protein
MFRWITKAGFIFDKMDNPGFNYNEIGTFSYRISLVLIKDNPSYILKSH